MKQQITWTLNLAVEYAEGWGRGENATQGEQLQAWAHLIKTGYCWQLQGFFGRMAYTYIQRRIISKEGEILVPIVD